MKIILLFDVAGVGKKGEVKTVGDGFAQNFLIRRGLARFADKATIAASERQRQEREVKEAVQRDLLRKTLESLRGARVLLRKKANDQGHLFEKIHEDEVAEIINKTHKVKISAEHVQFDEPIKSIGVHKVRVSAGDFSCEVNLEIEAA